MLPHGTFLVVRRGNPLLKSKRICRPKTLTSPLPVLWSFFQTPFFKISSKRSRYWYSGCFLLDVFISSSLSELQPSAECNPQCCFWSTDQLLCNSSRHCSTKAR